MILFGVTSYNEIMYNLIAEKSSRDTTIVLSDRADTYLWARETNVDAIYNLQLPLLKNQLESDELFADIALPGLFRDTTFPKTNLPLSSVLSLDRLKFWFDAMANERSEYVNAFSPKEIYVSSDLGSTLPWIIYLAAKEKEIPITLVQTENLRTPEFLDFIKILRFDNIVVSPDNENFIKDLCEANIVVRELKKDGEKEVEYPKKEELRNGLGIPKGAKVACVLFDKRDEWQCRKWLSEHINEYFRVFVYPMDNRSLGLAYAVLHKFLPHIIIVSDRNMLYMADDVVAFRYYHDRFGGIDISYETDLFNGVELLKCE